MQRAPPSAMAGFTRRRPEARRAAGFFVGSHRAGPRPLVAVDSVAFVPWTRPCVLEAACSADGSFAVIAAFPLQETSAGRPESQRPPPPRPSDSSAPNPAPEGSRDRQNWGGSKSACGEASKRRPDALRGAGMSGLAETTRPARWDGGVPQSDGTHGTPVRFPAVPLLPRS